MILAVFGLIALVPAYAAYVSVWDGTVPRNEDGYTLSGSGTESDPYLIQSANDLAFFAIPIEHGS